MRARHLTTKDREVLANLRTDVFGHGHGYPLILVMEDGEVLCHFCARKEWRQIICETVQRLSHVNPFPSGWATVGMEVFWEGPPLYCAHCDTEIESAYGDPDSEDV